MATKKTGAAPTKKDDWDDAQVVAPKPAAKPAAQPQLTEQQKEIQYVIDALTRQRDAAQNGLARAEAVIRRLSEELQALKGESPPPAV